MTDYSFEACTKEHPPQPEQLVALGGDPVEWARFYHKRICLAFDREHEFQLRVPLKGT